MKIDLFFPPQWTPAMPHLALPTLTGYLRKKGINVRQRDLNIELYDHMLSRASLEAAVESVRRNFGPKVAPAAAPRVQPDRKMVEWVLAEGLDLARRVDQAKAVMRSKAFYDPQASLEAFLVLVQSLQLVSLPFHPAWIDFLNFHSAYQEDSSKDLLAAAEDARTNPFLAYYQQHVLPDLVQDPPDIVGISIPTLGQMLAGMTLGRLIKKSGLPCHVTIGGPHITMLREQFKKAPAIFQCFDSAVIGEGEVPLLRLAEAVQGGGDLSSVPNLIYYDAALKRVRINAGVMHPLPKQEMADDHACKTALDCLPDFDGLPLDRYLVPEPVLPLVTSHGCYHGKCAFCNVGYGWNNNYRQLPAAYVVEQMEELQRRYGVRHIFFADEAITPRNLRAVSALIEEKSMDIHWCGCVRFDHPLSADLLNGVGRGGGRMLLFGLETASEPMIEHMVKGTRLEHMSRILRESTAAGIWNHTFFFFGFPGETIEHAQDTVNFLYAHQQYVHSASPGSFVLERYAPAHLYPKQFGVSRIIQSPERDLAIYFDYQVERGIDDQTAELLVSHLLNAVPGKRYGQYYMHDTYKLLYASYLHDQGKPYPLWLAQEDTSPST